MITIKLQILVIKPKPLSLMKQWPSCCFPSNVPIEASSTFHKAILQAHSQRDSSRNEENCSEASLFSPSISLHVPRGWLWLNLCWYIGALQILFARVPSSLIFTLVYEAPSLPASANVAYRRPDDKTTSPSASDSLSHVSFTGGGENHNVWEGEHMLNLRSWDLPLRRGLVYTRRSPVASNKGMCHGGETRRELCTPPFLSVSYGLHSKCTWKGVAWENIGGFYETWMRNHLPSEKPCLKISGN